MEEQPAREQLSQNAPSAGSGAQELFGYVGIEAVLDQMRIKTMKAGFEFNIMVVGEFWCLFATKCLKSAEAVLGSGQNSVSV